MANLLIYDCDTHDISINTFKTWLRNKSILNIIKNKYPDCNPSKIYPEMDKVFYVQEYKKSNLSVVEFCKEKNFCWSGFYKWIKIYS